MLFAASLLSLLLHGCPDPNVAPPLPGADGQAPGAAVQGDGTMPAPTPGGAMAPGGGPPPPVGFTVVPGEGITLTGTIEYAGAKSGKIRIDFLKTVNNNAPQLVHTIELSQLGPWSVEAPKDLGGLRVVGFLDQTGDGPSAEDPAMAWPEVLTIAQAPIADIKLKLSDTPDLGDLTPGSAPTITAPAPGGGAPEGQLPAGTPPGGAPGAGAPTGAADAPPAGAPPAGAPPAGAPPAGAPPAAGAPNP